jgi:hypothetical protein
MIQHRSISACPSRTITFIMPLEAEVAIIGGGMIVARCPSSMAAYRTVSAYGRISTAGLRYQIGCHPSERDLNTVTLNTNRMHHRRPFAPVIVRLNITGKPYCDGRMTRIFCDQRYGIGTRTITAVQPSHTVTVHSPISYACTYSKGMIHVHTRYSNRTSK